MNSLMRNCFYTELSQPIDFLLKKNRLFEFENAILSFIRKKVLKIKNHTQAFKALKEQLIEIKKRQIRKRTIGRI